MNSGLRFYFLFLKDYFRNFLFGKKSYGNTYSKSKVKSYFDKITPEFYENVHISAKDDPFIAPLFSYPALLTKLLNEQSIIVDLGCGQGYLLRKCNEQFHGTYLGIDISENAIRSATHGDFGNKGWYTVADVECVPLASNIADVVFCINVLPYLKSVDGLIREVARILKDDGLAVIVYPVDNHYWDLEFDDLLIFIHDRTLIGNQICKSNLSVVDTRDIKIIFIPLLPFSTKYAEFLLISKGSKLK